MPVISCVFVSITQQKYEKIHIQGTFFQFLASSPIVGKEHVIASANVIYCSKIDFPPWKRINDTGNGKKGQKEKKKKKRKMAAPTKQPQKRPK
jgi:hypothetical protein